MVDKKIKKPCPLGKKDKIIVGLSILLILSLISNIFIYKTFDFGKKANTTGVMLEQEADANLSFREIVREEILQNEYNKVGGKENFDLINEIQIPQIESSLQAYKQQQAQAAIDAQPKYLTQEEITNLIDSGYNQGSENPKYIWIEYSEMECPYCIKFANSNAKDMVMEAYGDDIMYGFRNYPLNFHENAMTAALVAECVGAEKGVDAYFAVIAEAFSKQEQDLDSMISYAKEAGVNEDTVKTCVNNKTYEDKINNQMQYGINKFGITGTPGHVVINTETGEYVKVSGVVGGSTLIQAIEQIK